MKWLAVKEPSAARYLSNEANGNVRSTEMILIIVDNHLKTFSLHFSLLWLHICCGLDTPHNNTTITSCCIQAATSCSCSLAVACFLWAPYALLLSFSMNLIPEAWLKAGLKVTGDVPTGYLFVLLEKKTPSEKSGLSFLESALTPKVNLKAEDNYVKQKGL